MELSKRLQAIADFVKEGAVVGDIGTDHGYIPVYLIKNGLAKRAIAADISRGSLDKAEGYIRDLNLEGIIDTRLGNGLEVIEEGELDTVIIAGMGGILISEILEESKKVVETIDHFIFQPMLGSEKLREYLVENNFKIVDEALIKENGKFYEIIYATHGKMEIERKLDYEISPILLERRDKTLKDFLEHKISYNKSIMEKIDKTSSDKSRRRFLQLEDENENYKGVLSLYEDS